MTFPTRDDITLLGVHTREDAAEKPRLDWLLLLVLTLDLGVWVGVLAWWIWR